MDNGEDIGKDKATVKPIEAQRRTSSTDHMSAMITMAPTVKSQSFSESVSQSCVFGWLRKLCGGGSKHRSGKGREQMLPAGHTASDHQTDVSYAGMFDAKD